MRLMRESMWEESISTFLCEEEVLRLECATSRKRMGSRMLPVSHYPTDFPVWCISGFSGVCVQRLFAAQKRVNE